jgi:hypothetical protein
MSRIVFSLTPYVCATLDAESLSALRDVSEEFLNFKCNWKISKTCFSRRADLHLFKSFFCLNDAILSRMSFAVALCASSTKRDGSV